MISAAIIGIPSRQRIVRHDGGGAATVKLSTWPLGGIFFNPKYHKNFT